MNKEKNCQVLTYITIKIYINLSSQITINMLECFLTVSLLFKLNEKIEATINWTTISIAIILKWFPFSITLFFVHVFRWRYKVKRYLNQGILAKDWLVAVTNIIKILDQLIEIIVGHEDNHEICLQWKFYWFFFVFILVFSHHCIDSL